MPGQAIVRIRDKQWQVALATAPLEQAKGLGGILSIPPGTGMLFDLGYDQVIAVTTVPMLFPLDIAFISNSLTVVDVGKNVPPGLMVSSSVPARFFLEVNAGELEGIDTGDRVYIQFLPGTAPQQIPDWVTAMFSFMGFAIAGMFMVAIARVFIKAAFAEPEKKPVLYGPREEKLLPQTKGEGKLKKLELLPQTKSEMRKEREKALIKLAAKVRRKRDEFEAALKAIGIDSWYYRDTATREELHKIWEKHPHILALDEELYKLQQEYNKLMLSPFGYPGEEEEEEEEEEETEEMPQTTNEGKTELSMADKVRQLGFSPEEFWALCKKIDEAMLGEKGVMWLPANKRRQGLEEKVYPLLREFEQKYGFNCPISVTGVDVFQLDIRIDNVLRRRREAASQTKSLAVIPVTNAGSNPNHYFYYVDGKEVPWSTFVKTWEEEFPSISATKKAGTWQGKHRYAISTKRLEEQTKVIPVTKETTRPGELEYFADSPEFLTQTVDSIGYREKIDETFQEAIARAKGLKQWQ